MYNTENIIKFSFIKKKKGRRSYYNPILSYMQTCSWRGKKQFGSCFACPHKIKCHKSQRTGKCASFYFFIRADIGFIVFSCILLIRLLWLKWWRDLVFFISTKYAKQNVLIRETRWPFLSLHCHVIFFWCNIIN